MLGSLRPWARMKRKLVPARPGDGEAGGWLYSTSSGMGREHATDAVEKIGWPQGCDQCSQLISPGATDGVRSFKVSRGLKPTTLYLCVTCVGDLCVAGGIPAPNSPE